MLLLALPFAPRAASAGERWDALRERVHPSASIEVEWAYGTDRERHQKLELQVVPEVEVDLFGDWVLTVIGRGRGDAYDRLEPGQPREREVSAPTSRGSIGDQVEYELREAYVQGTIGRVEMTLGKQQIVWGRADGGLKVLDVVNPQSFREFILDTLEDSRIPLWTVNVEVPFSIGDADFGLQALWIPDKSYHIVPKPDAVFAFQSRNLVPQVPAAVPVDLRDPDRPSDFFADSDAGARLSAFIGGWDLTVNYLYHYYDLPVIVPRVELAPTLVVAAIPRYKRTHLVGGTVTNSFGDLTVRGEVAWSSDRHFVAENTQFSENSDEFLYVAGFDWFGFDYTVLSLQVFQSALVSGADDIVRDDLSTAFTFFAQRTFLNETLRVEGIWLTTTDHGDGLLRPRVEYDFSDEVTGYVGFDWFYGSDNGLFGQFDPQDRLVLGVEIGI